MSSPSVEQAALSAAMARHRAGDIQGAVAAYRPLLDANPGDDALSHLLGLALCQGGRVAEGRPLIDAAIATNPSVPEYHNSLGLALAAVADATGAEAAYRRALAGDPRLAAARANLAALLAATGRWEEAETVGGQLSPDAMTNDGFRRLGDGDARGAAAAFRQALRADPQCARARVGLGRLLERRGWRRCAAARYRHALALDPDCADAHEALGCLALARGDAVNALARFRAAAAVRPDCVAAHLNVASVCQRMGLADDAAAAYRAVLAIDPNHQHAAYMLAATTGGSADVAPSGYVSSLFDSFADSFDAQLVGRLAYVGPQLAADMLGAEHADIIIDLGCGSGLCGKVLRPLARRLIGVDLSQRMLEKAGRLGLYDEFHQTEATTLLGGLPPAIVDLICAADMVIYLGDLAPLFTAARHALRAGGRLFITTEATDSSETTSGWTLRQTGRFAHDPAYIESAARAAGLDVATRRDVPALRNERGHPLPGHAFLFVRPK